MSPESVPKQTLEDAKANKSLILAFPVIHSLTWSYLFSLLILLLTAIASIAGLLFPNDIYPTAELRESFLANDVVTLFLGLPILIVSMFLARRGKLLGLLFWPGALFYGLYNYFAYLFGMPFAVTFPLYLLIVTLSAYATIGLVASIDGRAVKQRLDGHVPVRVASVVLFGFGFLTLFRVNTVIAGALTNQILLPQSELGLLVADFIIGFAWVIGSILLWRRQDLGYVGGTGLLFQAAMLFIGLIAILLLQPFLNDTPLRILDIIIVLIMSLISFIPFVLFLRGVVKS